MKRYSSNLSPEDRRTYRRWTGGLFLSYLIAVIVAISITSMNRPATDLRTSNDAQMARLKAASESFAPARSVVKP
jgi:hypothetical protein